MKLILRQDQCEDHHHRQDTKNNSTSAGSGAKSVAHREGHRSSTAPIRTCQYHQSRFIRWRLDAPLYDFRVGVWRVADARCVHVLHKPQRLLQVPIARRQQSTAWQKQVTHSGIHQSLRTAECVQGIAYLAEQSAICCCLHGSKNLRPRFEPALWNSILLAWRTAIPKPLRSKNTEVQQWKSPHAESYLQRSRARERYS